MNSTILGGSVRQGLKDAYMTLDSVDLCVGGCTSWKKTGKGIERYKNLQERFNSLEASTAQNAAPFAE